jgi:hypothetical protein
MNNRRITRQNVVRDGNRYCGPLVIAALLGCSTSEAAAQVREATNTDRPIKGMYNSDLIRTLAANGYQCVKQEVPRHYSVRRRIGRTVEQSVRNATRSWEMQRDGSIFFWRPDSEFGDNNSPYTPLKLVGPTLAAWLRTREDKAAVYVVNVTGHYVLVAGRKFVDTGTRGEWVNIGDAPHRRSRVENVWRVSR